MSNSESITTDETCQNESVEAVQDEDYSSVTFESITFSDGTTVALDERDVVVLVGPNNAGKSVALKELEQYVRSPSQMVVVKSAQIRRTGTGDDFKRLLVKNARVQQSSGRQTAEGYGFSISSRGQLEDLWPERNDIYHAVFCTRILTERRIIDSDPAATIPVLNTPPSHPVHMLYKDPEIELRISNYFNRAFGQDLILFRTGGSELPLLVGERIKPKAGETPWTEAFSTRLLGSTVQLAEQGDGMRSFASVVLHVLAPATPSILLLDEPEAFLHPPQARLLGEIISTERSSRAQLIVATHSPDVLQGLISVAPEHLRVLRMQRDGNVNRVKELDKELVKEISSNPLMRYSSVMSGVFHQRVIICESDADCMFYSSVLDLPEVTGEQQPDVLFVHAGGISRMATLANAMNALDVPVDVIADIDILRAERENDTLKPIVQALGGDWDRIQPLARSVRQVMEQARPERNAEDVRQELDDLLAEVQGAGYFPTDVRSKIQGVLQDASPWGAAKRAGKSLLPGGQPTQQFQELYDLCASIGFWIVHVGELERFCKPVGGHGPRWVQHVLEEKNLAEDDDLSDARKFLYDIWHRREV